MGTRGWDNKAVIEEKEWNDEVAIEEQDNEAAIGEQDNKRVAEQVIRTEEVRKLLCRTFFLATCFNPFLAFSFSELMIGWLLSLSLGLIANFGLLVTSINCDALSSR